METISYLISKILSNIFPATCIICRTSSHSVCQPCLKICSRAVDPPFTYITTAYSFKDPRIKKIIHAIKYFHRRDLIPPLVIQVTNDIKTDKHYDLPNKQWVLVPIPMPRLRKYMRGYNQAECIAQELGRNLILHVDTTILTRIRSPKRQVKTTTRSQRLSNQHNSFQVMEEIVGKNIIIVDDVTTTGATIHEARKVLLRAGANDVRAVTLAH